MNQVATMQTVQEKVKERIQAAFMELIPPEVFDNMVKAEIDRWTKDELPKLVKAAAEEAVKVKLKDAFNQPEWLEQYDPRNNMTWGCAPLVKKVIEECAPTLVAEMFNTTVMNVVQTIRNRGY